ncbi:tryptophan transporter [Peptacetobacter sp. AB800]|uniref:tryptophan transporter n=1 Tax=Peptacetobacter sp. AB800 TaxID=3388428 RepID=UPI0039FC5065
MKAIAKTTTNTTTKVNTRKMVLNSILLAIGLILHQITPALGLPMQPDFALLTMFIVVLINRNDYKSCLLAGIVTGVFTALTTKFPGGQLPNVIDKIISVNFAYLLVYIMYSIPFLRKMDMKKAGKIVSIFLFPLGTLVSGSIFLLAAQYIVGLPAGFSVLFISVVIPAVVINFVAGLVLYNVILRCIK